MLKVVIADDEVRICKLLRVLVDWEQLGFEIVAEEHDGTSLIARVRELQPQLVITDIRMPGLSGLELLHQLREEGNQVEVLIMSGYREFDYVHEALRNGASDYLLKPVSRNVLEETLKGVRTRVAEGMQKENEREQVKEVLHYVSSRRGRELMEAILTENLRSTSREKILEEYHCDYRKPYLFTVTVKSGIRNFDMQKASVLLNRQFSSQIEKTFKEAGLTCACAMTRNCHYLLAEAGSTKEMEEILNTLIRDLRVFLPQAEGSYLAVGYADADLSDLSRSLCRSREAMLDHLFAGMGQVLSYRDHGRVNPDKLINIRSAAAIQQVLTNCSEGKLQQLMDEYVSRIRETCTESESGAGAFTCFEALQAQLVHMTELIFTEAEIRDIPAGFTDLLDLCGSFGTVAQLFTSEAASLEQTIVSMKESKEKKPVRQLRQIISERYMEPLSLEGLAEELQMTPAYISRLFKKEIGENFTAYLNTVRLEKAKEMLSTTDEPASNIALSIGYSDEKYFMRLFKKETGLTTGEYRRLYGE